MKQDINWLLAQWGIWARQDGTGKIVNPTSPVFAGLTASSNGECLMIDDDTAMRIENALSLLKIRRPVCYAVLVMRHYHLMTTGSVARRVSCGRDKVRELERAGEAFIEGNLI